MSKGEIFVNAYREFKEKSRIGRNFSEIKFKFLVKFFLHSNWYVL